MNTQNPSSQRLTQALLALLVIGVWGLLLRLLLPSAHADAIKPAAAKKTTMEELTVQRINVVDTDGTVRLVLSNTAKFPDAVVRGKIYPRSISGFAGMVFFDDKGQEQGGLALAKSSKGDGTAALVFDFTHQPTDGVGIVKAESADGTSYSAGLHINDRLPYKAGEITTTGGVERIVLENKDRDAELRFADADGKERIRIGVDRAGKAKFEIFDPSGKVVYRAPVK